MSNDQLVASPFYAIPEAGRMECPHCSRILIWGNGAKRPDQRYWWPLSSILECSGCHRRYQLGIIAWPLLRGVEPGYETLPPGQKGTMRQLAEVRQRTGGFWSRRPRVKGEGTNRYVAEGCCCAPLPWRPECPVHGQTGTDPIVSRTAK